MGPPGIDPVYGFGRLQLDFAFPRAERDIEAPLGDNGVPEGGAFTVRLRVEMPYGRIGSVVLEEEVPAGFSVTLLETGGAEVSSAAGLIRWMWPSLEPGETREVQYRVTVGGQVAPGVYCWSGTINGRPVEGEYQVRIHERMSVLEVVAHWDSTMGKVNPDDPPHIDDEEVLQARTWWLENIGVPAAGGRRITWREMIGILAYWASGLPVDQRLESTPSCGFKMRPISVRVYPEQVEVRPDETFEVAVDLGFGDTVLGFGLEIRLPPGWELEPIDSAGAWFKYLGQGGGVWLWPRVRQGERKQIRLSVRASGEAGQGRGDRPRLTLAGGCPAFEQEIEVQTAWVMAPDQVSPVEIHCAPNPLRGGEAVRFEAVGAGINSIRVKIFALSGELVLDTGWQPGETFQWGLYDKKGHVVPNGVYLFVVYVEKVDGELVIGGIGKLLVLR